MRTTFKIALASVLVFTLAAAAPELNAQARRSTTTTSSTSSSSDNKSATTASRSSASSNASTASRSTSTANRSTGTTANRQSTTTSTSNRENTATRQSSTSNRSTATPSGSTSTQVRRGTNNGNTGNTGTTSTSQANRRTGTTATESTPNRQVNRNNGTTTNNGNNTGTAARRSTGTSNTETSTTRRQTTTGTTRSTTGGNATTETPSRRATTTRSNSTASTEAQATQSGTPVRTVRSNANTTSSRGLTSAPEASEAVKAGAVRGGVNANRAAAPSVNYSDGREEHGNIRMDKDRNLNRVPPRERDFMTYNRPGAFYGHDPHFFGYRVHTLPPRYRRISFWGRDYYYYNNVYYLRYGDWYVISRPPFGIALDIAIRDAVFASVRFSYYHSVYRTFDIVDRNYRTILEQNREIARNNELLARQNSALALNSSRALSAYEIASALGLIQSFANINTEYFYQDGVFYVINKKNRYEVIVPPAGALVNELPEDYDTIILNGIEYYKVDDTVYRLVLVDGIPALEVLGQMYGSMATKYNYYY